MPEKKNMKRAKSTPSRLSRRSAELIRLRRQRLYIAVGKVKKELPDATLSTQTTSSTTRAVVIEEHASSATSALNITITLLKEVTLMLHAPGGISRVVPLRNVKCIELLAYIAWRRGKTVRRDTMLKEIWGQHSRIDKGAAPTISELVQDFGDSKKAIRADIRKVAEQLNEELGEAIFPLKLDIFENERLRWWLSPMCTVTDLELIEVQHRIIAEAENNGLLFDTIPDEIKIACDALLTAYTGDYLEEIIKILPEVCPEWKSSWIRKPFTLYRDYYLQALWYAAEYEEHAGRRHLDKQQHLCEEEQSQKWLHEHFARAAQYYLTYAMQACSSRFDLGVSFGVDNRAHGERINMSERALRRCLLLYGALGSTHLVDQIYSRYYRHMRHISGRMWEPSSDTLRAMQLAKENTGAHRFSRLLTQHDPPIPPG
jgi:hypothetical protein